MAALSPEDIRTRLAALPRWQFADNALVRVVDCSRYPDALALVQRVGHLAEAMNHHPDFIVNYKRVTIRYWTHTAGGVTEKDFESARRVEALIVEAKG